MLETSTEVTLVRRTKCVDEEFFLSLVPTLDFYVLLLVSQTRINHSSTPNYVPYPARGGASTRVVPRAHPHRRAQRVLGCHVQQHDNTQKSFSRSLASYCIHPSHGAGWLEERPSTLSPDGNVAQNKLCTSMIVSSYQDDTGDSPFYFIVVFFLPALPPGPRMHT